MEQLNTNGNYQNDFNYAANNTNGSIQENFLLPNQMSGNNSIVQSDSLLIDGVMQGSFNKGSVIGNSNIQSLIGSLVMQEGEVDAQDVQDALRSAQLPMEGDDTPQVQEYMEDGIPAVEDMHLPQSPDSKHENGVNYNEEQSQSLETIEK